MKLAYVTPEDPLSVASWSGTNRSIALALAAQGVELQYVGPLRNPFDVPQRVRYHLQERLRMPRYLPSRSVLTARSYAREIAGRLEDDVDAVFATGTIPVAFLETELPVVFWADAAFAEMLDFYPAYSRIARGSVTAGNRLEQMGLDRADLAIYSSDWGAQSALRHYDVAPEKVDVVPFGANIDPVPEPAEIEAFLGARAADRLQLLFLAVEWERKGGDLAIETARLLNERGIPTTLVVVGCTPPDGEAPGFVDLRGFVSKKTDEGRAELRRLLAESNLLIHPARADATPVALPEASAHGLPVLAAAVGGIPTIIRDGVNGYALSAGSAPEAYAALAAVLAGDPGRYRALALSAAAEFRTRLNWTSAGAAVVERVRALLDARSGGALGEGPDDDRQERVVAQ